MKKLLAIVFALVPTFIFANEIKVLAFDNELEMPLEGVRISVKDNPNISLATVSRQIYKVW